MYGAILRVDLTSEEVSTEAIPLELCRNYIGGAGINSRLLWDHFLGVDPGIDPLSPDNVLISGSGPLAGTGFGAGAKMKWTFKSPLTNMLGDTSSGGFLGSQLRWAGYDHVVITGKAEHPVYLWIDDDSVEIRDARKIWGQDTRETEVSIRKELGDDVDIASIGPGGENLVRFASIVCTPMSIAGRCGGGAVFGSKNLKAIAARGSKGVRIHDPEAFFRAIDALVEALAEQPLTALRKVKGTLLGTAMLNVLGHNPYKSGRGIMIPEDSMNKLDADWYMDNLAVRSTVACSPGCLTACRGWYRIKGDESPAAERYAGELGHKPEYGGWSPFAANCAILDFPAVVHMNRLCTRYGFDTMEAGSVIAFLMELWEREIVTEDDMVTWTGEPLSLDWGDYEAVEKVLAAIASQENRLGQILNGSTRKVAERVGEAKGVPVVQYACYGKGGINHDESERGWPSMCSAMALSPIGAHHSKGIGFIEWAAEYFLGTTEAGGMMATKMQGKALAISQNAMAFVNALGMCNFIAGNYGWDPSKVTPELLAEALSAATGVRFTAQDLFEGADRINNVEKAFNSRLGLRRDDDTVCHRWLKEPILEGESRGIKAEDYLEQIKDEYYEYAGWDRDTALQTRERLLELDLEDVAAVLEKENALA